MLEVEVACELEPAAGSTWSGPVRSETVVRQLKAIIAALTRGDLVDRDKVFVEGLPGCGPIRRLAARIHELREIGYVIRTNWDLANNTCTYELV